jgi:hypothetical protein
MSYVRKFTHTALNGEGFATVIYNDANTFANTSTSAILSLSGVVRHCN